MFLTVRWALGPRMGRAGTLGELGRTVPIETGTETVGRASPLGAGTRPERVADKSAEAAWIAGWSRTKGHISARVSDRSFGPSLCPDRHARGRQPRPGGGQSVPWPMGSGSPRCLERCGQGVDRFLWHVVDRPRIGRGRQPVAGLELRQRGARAATENAVNAVGTEPERLQRRLDANSEVQWNREVSGAHVLVQPQRRVERQRRRNRRPAVQPSSWQL